MSAYSSPARFSFMRFWDGLSLHLAPSGLDTSTESLNNQVGSPLTDVVIDRCEILGETIALNGASTQVISYTVLVHFSQSARSSGAQKHKRIVQRG